MVSVSVRLSVCVSCAKTDEPIEMSFGGVDFQWPDPKQEGTRFRRYAWACPGLPTVDIVFTIFLPSNPGHLVPCTLDNVGTILCYQTSNMILIKATLMLVHFFIMSKFYVFLCARVCIVLTVVGFHP